ncbi:MAG: hypothetical protein JWM47_3074 [Acidimicrobiales bacterium]|nr:hypothetical protein [Acidimicrobiales bacterium]
MPKPITSRPISLAIALVAVGSLFAGACSSSGADDAVTKEDLEAILPTADKLGDGWKVNTKPDDDKGSGPNFDELCPDAAAIDDGNDSDDSDHAKAKFINEAGEEIMVELDPSAKTLGKEQLDGYVKALNDCKPTTTDEETGLDTAFDFEVNTLDEYGDEGVQIEAHITVSGESLPDAIEITLYGFVYRDGPVGVQIMGQDGLDRKTLEVTSFDPDKLITLAEELDPKVAKLAD